MIKIAPSILAADFLDLDSAVRLVNSHADLFHMDVMDGVYVPNITFGFPVVRAVASKALKPLDIHMMTASPEKYAAQFARIPAVGMVSFHPDATDDPAGVLQSIKEAGAKAGLAINPDVPLEVLYPYLEHCDFVTIMSVFAGFGGQKFIPESLERVSRLKKHIQEYGLNTEIEIDGGINLENAACCAEAGADILVAGTSVFKADSPESVISQLRRF